MRGAIVAYAVFYLVMGFLVWQFAAKTIQTFNSVLERQAIQVQEIYE